MPAVATYNLTGDPYIDGLLGDTKWGSTSLTYSSPTSSSYYGSGYGDGEPGDNFKSLSGTQKSTLDATLDTYASYTGLRFSEITETNTQHADMRFAMSDTPPTAWAYFPGTSAEGGDAWFNTSAGWYDNPQKGNYAYSTFMHETGHALGLEHPQTDNVMPVDRDSLEYSVMSYRSYVGKSLGGSYSNETWGYPQSLMMYDIAALQHLYGANYNTNSGNTTYSWSPKTGEMFIDGVGQGAPGANRIFLTVWDGGGADTYDFSNYSGDLDVNLRPGEWTTTSSSQLAKLHHDGSQMATGNIANALQHNGDPRSLIENAVGGSGNDTIIGNAADNRLEGRMGNDEIRGAAGDDRIFGHAGDDRLFGGGGNDIVRGGGGNDLLRGGGGDDRLAGGSGEDILVGGPGDDFVFGGQHDDVLRGGDGNDRLVGGPGADVLRGNNGNDVLIGGPGGDLLIGGAGNDTFLFRSINHSLPNDMDTIRQFVPGEDTIYLRPIDADTTSAGKQAFTFIDNNPFSQKAGELNFRNEILSGDVDGDGIADFQIHFAGVSSLSDSDFIL